MDKANKMSRVFFGLHLYRYPECPAFWSSLKRAVNLLKQHGYTVCHGIAYNDPYIQKARNNLVAQFLKSNCGIFIFIADDLGYSAKDMLRLIETSGEIVAGAYRLKTDEDIYPVRIHSDSNGKPLVRSDGCISATMVQTGFLRIQRNVFKKIAKVHPELAFYGIKNGMKVDVQHDFFPQGVHNHKWVGEDYAFCNLWTGIGGNIWIVPDMDLTHYSESQGYLGNYHKFLMSLPGGKNHKG
jgi:hypothetical protein